MDKAALELIEEAYDKVFGQNSLIEIAQSSSQAHTTSKIVHTNSDTVKECDGKVSYRANK